MAVNDGNPVDAATTNAAFVSRLIDTSTIGVLALSNPSSGGLITNAQQQINTNESDIATNAADIATNAADIVTLQNSVTFKILQQRQTLQRLMIAVMVMKLAHFG